ncbi:MAG: hypothetical protein WBD22_10805 [Pyrinomonadaceae bacterium]
MGNEFRLNELLKFRPMPHYDPVPPWLFELLDQSVLRDLAVISLDRHRAHLGADLKAAEAATALLKKAKF